MTSYESTAQHLDPREPPTCVLIQDLLPLYIEGEVSAESREVIAAHLTDCERCSGFLAGAQSVRAQFRREQSQRETAAARERLIPSAGGQPALSSVIMPIFGGLCLVALVWLVVLNLLNTRAMPMPFSDVGIPIQATPTLIQTTPTPVP